MGGVRTNGSAQRGNGGLWNRFHCSREAKKRNRRVWARRDTECIQRVISMIRIRHIMEYVIRNLDWAVCAYCEVAKLD
jgi:hypothetical protein